MLHDVGAVEDFADGRPRVLTVDGREIGVLLWQGRAYGVGTVCPHMGGPVCEGTVFARMRTEDALLQMEADDERPMLVCPWHGWSFDIPTGNAIFELRSETASTAARRKRIRTYDAKVADGRVLVDLPANRANRGGTR